MNNQEIENKAEELSKLHSCKVHPLVFQVDTNGDEKVIGFVKEPMRMVKQRVLDAGLSKGPVTAAGELLEAILIKEESDERMWVEKPEYDKYFLGASMAAMELIKVSQDLFKKK